MFKKVTESLSDAARKLQCHAERLSRGGRDFLESTLGRIPLFAGTRVYEMTASCEADETHYFLVPYRLSGDGYAFHIQRALPVGTGLVNSLPKRRVFHLPDPSGRDRLESLLQSALSSEALAGMPEGSDLADRLEGMAEAIDTQSSRVTGGLLIVGGMVAVANPLLGVGIAAKALLPAAASVATKGAVGYVSDKLRSREKQNRLEDAAEEAADEIRKLKPEIFENPLLRLLEQTVSTADPAHDPSLEELKILPSLPWMRVRGLTISAIAACYRDLLDDQAVCVRAALHEPDVQWLRALTRGGTGPQRD